MQKRTRAIVLTASMTVAGIALGATIASAANSSSTKVPALQSSGQYVFACVNPEGGIDYLEFRAPLPHQCWFAGESLWYWDAVPLAPSGTYPTPTYSPSPTPSATTASPTPSPTPSTAPVLAGIETTALSYTEGAAAEDITADLTVADSANLNGATVTITSGFVSTADTLSFATLDGITGTFTTSNGMGIMTLSGTASAADYEAALLTVKFASTTTTAGTRTVSFQATDVNGGTSNTETRTIDVVAPTS